MILLYKGSEEELETDEDDHYLNLAIEKANAEYEVLRQSLRPEDQLWFEINRDIRGECLRQKVIKQLRFLRSSRKKGFSMLFVGFVNSLRRQVLVSGEIMRVFGGGDGVESRLVAFDEKDAEEPPLKKVKIEKQFTLDAFFGGTSNLKTVQLEQKRRPGRPKQELKEIQIDVSALQIQVKQEQ
jgi:hypothetical protein